MDGLLEDGLGLIDFELGLEVAEVVGGEAAVGAATGVGDVEAFVRNDVSDGAPGNLLAAMEVVCVM